MTSSSHLQLTHSPVCCLCISIKFFVLFLQAAEVIFQTFRFAYFSGTPLELSVNVLMIIYASASFAVFLYEHKGLMKLHCLISLVSVLVAIIVYTCYHFDIYNPEEFGLPLKHNLVTLCFEVIGCVIYIALCWTLVRALEKNDTLPRYVTTVQPAYNVEYMSQS